jgi:hypothetical protein
MSLPELRVRHGTLGQLQGPPRKWQDIVIAPALVSLKGNSWGSSHEFSEHLAKHPVPKDVSLLFLDGYDGPWVRGRIQRVFLVDCPGESDRGEKTGLQFEFIGAVPQADGSMVGVPFWCQDYYLRTCLMFSEQEDPPPAELSDQIADAFWNLLLADPHDLPKYTDKLYHSGAGVWLEFGIAGGQPYIEEHDEEPTDVE